MNYSVTTTTTNLPTVIDPRTFVDFIKWIDRNAKTTQTYLTNLRQFAAWTRYAKIATPTRDDIIAYRKWLETEHDAIAFDNTAPDGFRYRTDGSGRRIRVECKPTTIAGYIRCVRQFFKWASSVGICQDITTNIHAPRIRQDIHRKDALAASDVLAIERSISSTTEHRVQDSANAAKDSEGKVRRASEQGARLRAMYLLAVTAGLRCVELSRARVQDFQTIGGRSFLYVWGKWQSEANQKKALAPEVASAIREYLRSRKDKPTANSPLFVSTGNRSGGRPIASTTISKMLKQAMQAAGYDSVRLTAHSLRHTAGTAVYELTHDLYQTQRYIRHSSPITTEIYLHCQDDNQDSELAGRLFKYYENSASATY